MRVHEEAALIPSDPLNLSSTFPFEITFPVDHFLDSYCIFPDSSSKLKRLFV